MKAIRVDVRLGESILIRVFKSSPTSHDNTVEIWEDTDGLLHIRATKSPFSSEPYVDVIESPSHVEVIQS